MTPTVDFGQVQYGCTKYKRRMVLYESVTHPGKRFEFCYSSSYQDKRGVETAYYKCVGCMHAKRYNDGRRIPKIAVRQGRLVNSNPDRPSNFPHFCQPIDSALSDRRQRERETAIQQQFISTAAHQQQQQQQQPQQQFLPGACAFDLAQTASSSLTAATCVAAAAAAAQVAATFGNPGAAAAAMTPLTTASMQSFGSASSASSSGTDVASIFMANPRAVAAGATFAGSNARMDNGFGPLGFQMHHPNMPHSLAAQTPADIAVTAAQQHQINAGTMQAAMQHQIQQLAANCGFVSPLPAATAAAAAAAAANQHFLGMAAAAGGGPGVFPPASTNATAFSTATTSGGEGGRLF